MSIKETKKWFEQAIPEPTIEQACIQIGCHYEEISEMLSVMVDDRSGVYLEDLSQEYKQCSREHMPYLAQMNNTEKQALLDSLVDQIVTAVGVGHMMGMDVLGALEEVNRSNFSKFENGKPIFDENGKITKDKSKDYTPPDLTPYV